MEILVARPRVGSGHPVLEQAALVDRAVLVV